MNNYLNEPNINSISSLNELSSPKVNDSRSNIFLKQSQKKNQINQIDQQFYDRVALTNYNDGEERRKMVRIDTTNFKESDKDLSKREADNIRKDIDSNKKDLEKDSIRKDVDKSPRPTNEQANSKNLVNSEIFEENSEIEDDVANSSSGFVWINIAINMFFVFSFLRYFRSSEAHSINQGLILKLASTPFSLSPNLYLQDISRLEQAANFIDNILFQNIFKNIVYSSTLYNRTSAPNTTQSSNYNFINTWILFEGMKISYSLDPYLQNSTILDNQTSRYYNGLTKYDEITRDFKPVINSLADGSVRSIQIEFTMFNIINEIGLLYTTQMFIDDSSEFDTLKKIILLQTKILILIGLFHYGYEVLPFYPKTFDDDSIDSLGYALLITSTVIFTIQLFMSSISLIINDIYLTIKTFLDTHRIKIDMFTIFDVTYVIGMWCFLIVTFISWDNYRNTFNKEKIFENVAEFEHWKKYALFTRNYTRLFSFAIYIIFVKNLIILKTKFPSFGVLFYTLSRSKLDLILFLFCLISLLLGFVTTFLLCFGFQSSDLSSFKNAFFSAFQFLMGSRMLDTLNSAITSLGPVICFLFYLMLNLTLINVFAAIIMSTYTKLRKEMQLTTLALTELAKAKSKELKDKWVNLLTFQPPANKKNENNKPKIENLNKPDSRNEQKMTHENKTHKTQMTLFEILIYNLEELDWFGFRPKNNYTKQESAKILLDKKIEILNNKKEQKKAKLKNRAVHLFNYLLVFLILLIFNILFVIMLQNEIYNEENFDLYRTMVNHYTKPLFKAKTPTGTSFTKTFNQISDIQELNDWFTGVYMSSLYPNFTREFTLYNHSKHNGNAYHPTNSTRVNEINNHTILIGPYATRISIRKLQLQHTQSKYVDWYTRPLEGINVNDEPKSYEFTEDKFLASSLYGTDAYNLTYTPSGNLTTPYSNGGFIFNFPRNLSKALDMYYIFSTYGVINVDLATLTLEFIFYNPNYEMIGLNTIAFTYTVNGVIDKQIKTRAIALAFYSGKTWLRGFIEIVYLLSFIINVRQNIINWRVEWRKLQDLFPYDPSLREKNYLSRLINYDISGESNASKLVIAILRRIYQFCNRILTATYDFCASSAANLLLGVSNILSFVGFIYMLSLICNNFRLDFYIKNPELSQYDHETGKTIITQFEIQMNLLNDYTLIQSINSWLFMASIVCSLKFSGEMNLILELLEEAILDIVFFILLFIKVIIAFALTGYFAFGSNIPAYSSLSRSFMQCFLLMLSKDKPDYLQQNDVIFGVIYYLFLMIIMYLIFFKMFIAILDGHFSEISSEKDGAQNEGFLGLILIYLEEKINNMLVISEPNPEAKFLVKVEAFTKIYSAKIIKYLFNFFSQKSESEQTKPNLEIENTKKNILINFDDQDQSQSLIEDIKIYIDTPSNNTDGNKDLEFKNSEFSKRDFTIPQKDLTITRRDITISKRDFFDDPFISGAHYKKEQTVTDWMMRLENDLECTSQQRIKLSEYGSQSKDFLDQNDFFSFKSLRKIEYFQKGLEEKYMKKGIQLPFITFILQEAQTFLKLNSGKTNSNDTICQQIIEYLHILAYLEIENAKKAEDAYNNDNNNNDNDNNNNNNNKDNNNKSLFDNSLLDFEALKLRLVTEPLENYDKQAQAYENSITLWNSLPIYLKYQILIGKYSNQLSIIHKINLFSDITLPHKYFEDFYDQEEFKKLDFDLINFGRKEINYIMYSLSHKPTNINDSPDSKSKKQTPSPTPNSNDFNEKVVLNTPISPDNSSNNKTKKNNIIKKELSLILEKEKETELDYDNDLGNENNYKNSNQETKLTIHHIKLAEQLLYGKNRKFDNLHILIQRESNAKDRIKLLTKNKHVAGNHKLVLWYLMPIAQKMEFIQNCKSKMQTRLMMLLLMEEVTEYPFSLLKIERDVIKAYKNKIYMHFFLFASTEILSINFKETYKNDERNMGHDLKEYAKYLESQVQKLDDSKKVYLMRIQDIIKLESEKNNYDIEHERQSQTLNLNNYELLNMLESPYANMKSSENIGGEADKNMNKSSDDPNQSKMDNLQVSKSKKAKSTKNKKKIKRPSRLPEEATYSLVSSSKIEDQSEMNLSMKKKKKKKKPSNN